MYRDAVSYQLRYRFQFDIVVKTPLHVGGGRPEEGTVQFLHTSGNVPYIPGSSIKGMLRAHLYNALGTHAGALLGREVDGQPINGGKLHFHDAPGSGEFRVAEHVSLDPVTRTANDKLLYSVEYAPTNTRVYFGAQRLYRSDDRGESWRPVSPDLTRQLDRNQLPVMGKVWGADAVQKSVSTALYGNVSAIAESPKQEGLIYAGTDDGLIQVTEDGGKTWRKIDKLTIAPDDAYVQRIVASQHDAATVYAVIDNHQNGDFKPYLLKSTDRGRTWVSIAGNLPETGSVYAFAEDHINPKLLFAGTEFGLYFTQLGGQKWTKLAGGLPTIQVRDLAIQKRENDLVVGTFGRGIYILDDYSPLRTSTPESLEKGPALFSIRKALSYWPASPLGQRDKGFQGEAFYAAPNPPFGAIITYYLNDPLRTKKQERQRREREAARKNQTLAYPTPDELRAEAEEEPPAVVLTIANASGKVMRRLDGPVTRGFQRIAWDLREPAPILPPPARPAGRRDSEEPAEEEEGGFRTPRGPLVVPGKYTVTAALRINGVLTPVAGSQTFDVVAEGVSTREDRIALAEFQEKLASLQKATDAAGQAANEARTRLAAIIRAIDVTPSLSPKLREQALALERQLNDIIRALRGDTVMRDRNEATPESISERVSWAASSLRQTTGRPTKLALDNYQIASSELAAQIPKLRTLIETDIRVLEKQLDAAGAPPTPGRLPEWKR